VSWWLAEFIDAEMEQSFQSHVQSILNRQLKIALAVWAVLLLLFAVPDYSALGLTKPFYILLSYRLIIAAALMVMIATIKPTSSLFKISYGVSLIIMAGFSGFMLLFVYRPDMTNWIVGVIMLQLIGLLMFIPMRYIWAFLCALYGVVITMLTRWIMGSTRENLIGLFFLLMLPVVIGAATTARLASLQRRQFALLKKTEKINSDLQSEIQQRLKLETDLKALAATDSLTGLYNRREYEMIFRHEIERTRRMGAQLSVCILDLDHFKQVNDTYGHGIGDDVLRRTADLCRSNVRSMDVLGRLGGEEFIILLPETGIEQAVMVGHRLRKALEGAAIDTGTSIIHITATMGITALLPGDEDINPIIQRADKALYQGKAAGRNRVEVSLG
jgi:diguanylate cyclase (GGDEF)-like protein